MNQENFALLGKEKVAFAKRKFEIVTTQPNINLTQLKLRLDIIIKPKTPPHPAALIQHSLY